MPGASNASTSSVGHGTESSTKTAIHIHSNHVSQRELIQVLRDGCKPDTFNIEMRHNVYTVYLEKDSVDHVESLLPDRQRIDGSRRQGAKERRGSQDSVSDTSDSEAHDA